MISGLFSLPLSPADAAQPANGETPREPALATCETFVAGPENALVRTLVATVGSSDLRYNPIVLYGPQGVGKSSLAHALAARRSRQFGLASVLATTGAELAGALAHAIESDSVGDFRARYQRCDLLLIDDAHRLAGRPAAQQFLVSALDALVRRGSLIIATLRQSPEATAGLTPTLASRLAGGLVAGLAPPGLLARKELVRQSAARAGLSLGEDQVSRLAGSYDGPDHRFTTAAKLRRAVLELAAANEFGPPKDNETTPLINEEPPEVKAVCRQAAAIVARHFGMTATELKGKSRRKTVAEARSLAMYIARRLTAGSYAELGRHFGGRDHTTVLHACRKVGKAIADDASTRRLADDLTTQIAAEGAL